MYINKRYCSSSYWFAMNKYRDIVLEMIAELRAIEPIREPQRELLTARPIEIRLGTTF